MLTCVRLGLVTRQKLLDVNGVPSEEIKIESDSSTLKPDAASSDSFSTPAPIRIVLKSATASEGGGDDAEAIGAEAGARSGSLPSTLVSGDC